MNRYRNQGRNFPTNNPNRNWQDFDDSSRYQNEDGDFRGQPSGHYGQGNFNHPVNSYGNPMYNNGRQQNLGRNSSQWQGNYDRGYAGGNQHFEGGRNFGGMNAEYHSGQQYQNYGFNDQYEADTPMGQYQGRAQDFGHPDFDDYGASRPNGNYRGAPYSQGRFNGNYDDSTWERRNPYSHRGDRIQSRPDEWEY